MNVIWRASVRVCIVYRFRGRGDGNERRLLLAAIYDPSPLLALPRVRAMMERGWR